MVKVAADTGPAEMGVPIHSSPAIPYRRDDAAGAPSPTGDDTARQNATDQNDAAPAYYRDEAVPRQTLQRYYQTHPRDYADRGYSYAPPAYGPPPRWQGDWRDVPPPPPPRFTWGGPYDRW